MTVIDFTAARAAKAAELQAAREVTEVAIASVAAMAEAYAVMAFAVSGPIRLANERLAVDINRSQFRRALATVKKATRKAVPEVRMQFRDLASHTFTAKLDELIRDDDRRRGAPPAFEVIGGMWVATGRTPWKPAPWPCLTTLGRDGALAWMAHIETTPYAMKPATRTRFDEARAALQDPKGWPSTASEAAVDRIIRSCWERGWRPEEKAA